VNATRTLLDPLDRTAAEIAAGVTPANFALKPGHLYRYGTNTTPGTTDMTTALNNCYAACKAAVRVPMIIPAESQRFTSKLTWDGSVDVIGESSEFSILKKDGDFDGIEIDGGGQQSRYQDFFLDAVNDVAGDGIRVLAAAHLTMDRVSVYNQAGHGIELAGSSDTGFDCEYRNLSLVLNGGDGMRVGANHFASLFDNIDTRGNTGWGFKMLPLAAYHSGRLIVCQSNVAGGAEIAGHTSDLGIYGESNTGTDIVLTTDSSNNKIDVLHVDSQADFDDLGTNNQGFSISASGVGYFAPSFFRPKRFTNAAGHSVTYGAGAAGDGASPFTGGTATLSGGDADGTGNADGGKAEMRGGSGTGTGREGDAIIQLGDGLAVVGAASVPDASAKWTVVSTTLGAVAAPKMTETQRDAIASPTAGLQVYNTTTNKLNFYNGTGWEAVTSA
jgi:hypothetical protein